MADGVFGFLGDLLGLNAGDPAIEAASDNKKALKKYNTQGTQFLDTAYTGAKGALDETLDITGIGDNQGIWADAMGLNGDGGYTRAMDAFHTGPGYQFQMDQGLQALERSAAARGGYQSGQTGLDTLKYSQGLADQSYQDWLGGINTGINRRVGSLGDLASLEQGFGDRRVGLLGDVTSGWMGANNQRAEGEGANKSGMSNLFGNVIGAVTGYGGF